MSVGWGAWRKRFVVVSCLVLALPMGYAQNQPAESPAATLTVLVENAQAQESRGRPDLAVQVWRQILLYDPQNTVALAGLARDLRLIGSVEKSNEALDSLRRIDPSNPEIARIEALSGAATESDLLRRAGALAREGKAEDAMRIYRQLFGDHPPGGTIGLAYYQTLFGAPNGKEGAIAGMRALAQQNPADPRFAITLGVTLTYDARTRDEGMRILSAHLNDPTAQAGLRQALIWNAPNPTTAPKLQAYLKEHPNDAEIANLIRAEEQKMAQSGYGIARTPAEAAAYTALHDHRTAEAEERFDALLAQEPHNGRVVAGKGFLRMQQKNFGEAIRYFTLAEQDGFRTRVVRRALAASYLWNVMGEALAAFNANNLNLAAIDYRDALSMDPHEPDALIGLAGVLTRQRQYAAAAGIYERLAGVQPGAMAGWRGLFLSYAQEGDNQRALATVGRFPPQVKDALERDPAYLRTLATVYQAEGRNQDAQRVLARALTLPFPGNGSRVEEDTKLEYAGILMAAGDTARALQYMDRVNAYYAKLKELPPPNLAIQDARLLYKTGGDRALYSALMQLGGRADLTAAQRQEVQDIWANWGVRSAGIAMNNGDYRRAVEILDAASQAFPGNLTARKAVAGGYVQVGQAKEALALYKTIPMQNATSADFQGAIGAALAANDETQAEIWLPQALARYSRDPAILALAARYEMARGDYQRAADYYRASLAAMPAASSVDKLAHVPVYPEEDLLPHRATTAADLYRLLNPDYQPFPKTTKPPPLPANGPNPNNGLAPAAHPPSKPASEQPQSAPTKGSGPTSENRSP